MKKGVSILAMLLFVVPSFAQSLTTATQKIKLLSWNIYMLPQPIMHRSSKLERATVIGTTLSKSDYDVLVFQEAFCPIARKKISVLLSEAFPYSVGPANQKKLSLKINSGIWIFSKYPIEEIHTIVYKSNAGIDGLSRKGAMLVEVNVCGQRIQIVGTHLQNAGNNSIRQAQCMELAERLLKPNAAQGVPQLVCGDFNINRQHSQSYRFMLNSLNARDGELTGLQKFSYDRRNNDLTTESSEGQELIDYILVRENGAWVDCKNRQITIRRNRWDANHEDLSDHFSLEAEVEFSNNLAIAAQRE